MDMKQSAARGSWFINDEISINNRKKKLFPLQVRAFFA